MSMPGLPPQRHVTWRCPKRMPVSQTGFVFVWIRDHEVERLVRSTRRSDGHQTLVLLLDFFRPTQWVNFLNAAHCCANAR
jgi:hypothetical protein